MSHYKMPKVDVGDPILWHIEGVPSLENAHAAIVTGVSGNHIDLTVFMPGRNPLAMISVRHISDPYLTENHNPRVKRENGGWDFSPLHKRLKALEGSLADVTKSRGK